MLYLDWFETLKSLISSGGRLSKIDDIQRLGVMFLGNMLMPSETHIIRLGEYGKLSFSPEDGQLGANPAYYLDEFRLPNDGVALEDSHSTIGLVDIKKGSRGLKSPRVYIYIEKPKSKINLSIVSIFDFLLAAEVEMEIPRDGFFTSWGVISDVKNMNIAEEPYYFGLTPLGSMVLSDSGIHHLAYSTDFAKMKHANIDGLEEFCTPTEKLFCPDAASAMVGNLHFAYLQVAYHNWFVDNSK